MRKINVKRLAALGAGIALLGAALAPAASAITLSRGDIINTTNGMPAVDIVVGANAKPSDAVWAGNIAAKIAQLAYTERPVSATPQWKEGAAPGEGVTPEVSVSDLSVDLVIGGETTYAAGTAYVFDDNYLDSVSSQPELNSAEYGQSKLSSLLNETWSYTYNGSSYTQTVKEYIGISADAKFEEHKDVKDLVLYLDDEGDFYYKVTFTAGIPYPFTKADQNTITIPFFGKKYTVLSASSSEVKLIDESNKYTYYNGERITGLTGKGSYAGQSLEVEFVTLTYNQAQGTYYAKFNLYDSEGNLIDTRDGISSDTFLENVFYVNGEYPLETSIYIQSLGKEDVSGKGYIVVTIGTNTIQLKDGDKYPYDPTVTSSSKKYWKVDLHTGTGTVGNESSRPVIDYIKIYNAGVEGYSKWDRKMPIYAETDSLTGHSEDSVAVFLNGEPEDTLGYGFAKVRFYGFKHNETTTELKIADHKIYYTDTGDTKHEIPLYISGLDSTSEEEFVFDNSGNKKYYFRIHTSTPDVNVCDGNYLNGIEVHLEDHNSDGELEILTDSGWKSLVGGQSWDINGVKWVITDTNYNASCVTLDTNGYFEIWDESFDSGSSSSNSVSGYNGAPLNYKFYFDAESAPDESTNFAVVKLEGDNSQNYYYAYFYDADTGEVWLLYDKKNELAEKNSYDLDFAGTDTDEDSNLTIDVYAYVPNETELGGGSSGSYYTAKFTLTEPSNAGTGYIYIDTDDGSLAPFGNTNYTPSGTELFTANLNCCLWTLNSKLDVFSVLWDYSNEVIVAYVELAAVIRPSNLDVVCLVVVCHLQGLAGCIVILELIVVVV